MRTVAVQHSEDGTQTATYLPEGAGVVVTDHVKVTSADEPNRQINVECNGSAYSLFLVDLRERGELIPPKRNVAQAES